jgi:hypothetical protein
LIDHGRWANNRRGIKGDRSIYDNGTVSGIWVRIGEGAIDIYVEVNDVSIYFARLIRDEGRRSISFGEVRILHFIRGLVQFVEEPFYGIRDICGERESQKREKEEERHQFPNHKIHLLSIYNYIEYLESRKVTYIYNFVAICKRRLLFIISG